MANRFWVGGTGTWDSTNTTSWSTATGGGGGATVPTSADVAIFDAASGGGTVTVAATINGNNTVSGITAGAFTGTLTFATNNPNITVTGSFNVSGTGARTITLGSSTFTLTGNSGSVWDAGTVTSLTPSFASATFLLQNSSFGGSATFQGGGQTYGTVTVTGSLGQGYVFAGNGTVIATLNVTAGATFLLFNNNMSITNAVTWTGSSTAPLVVQNTIGFGVVSVTLSASGGTATWAVFRGVTFVTNSLTATNSYNAGSVTNATITGPSGGGGGGIIGS
jgi:hypothetical protein